MPAPVAIIPLKDFGVAKGRLEIANEARQSLAAAVAHHTVEACLAAGLVTAVVTGSGSVADWARAAGCEVVDDPAGGGLSGAAAEGVRWARAHDRAWMVVHGDLPLLGVNDLETAAEALGRGETVIGPSRDGGTNLLGSLDPLDLRYGPASFHRHLAAAAGRPVRVLVTTGIAIEIDTLPDLEAAIRLPAGAWLERFLS